MYPKTLISNSDSININFRNHFRVGDYWVSTDANIIEKNGVKLIIDGYILPRKEYFDKFKETNSNDLILNLFAKEGKQLTKYIKGVFNIFLFCEKEWWVFTDHFSIRKIFIYNKNDAYYLSNDFNSILQNLKNLQVSEVGIMGNTLFNHYVLGDTYVDGVKYLPQASVVTLFKDNSVKIDTYWQYESLMTLHQEKKSFKTLTNEVKQITEQYLLYLKPKKLSISLTGGKDSRTILAALLHLNQSPFAFTYGNKNTSDSFYAKKIANGIKLNYSVYSSDIKIDTLWEYYKKIIEAGNPLINIHRAHRLKAFDDVKKFLGEDTCFWGGYLGGELLMGIYYDDLIFTSFIREKLLDDNVDTEKLISQKLNDNFWKISKNNINDLNIQLKALKVFDEQDKKQKEFHAIMDIGVLHHAQDMHLMLDKMKYMVPFFLDIDLLYTIFSSKHSMLKVNNDTKNIYKRQNLFAFNLNIQHNLAPVLDKFYFAKKGSFNTWEYINFKTILPFFRLFRRIFVKRNFSQPIYYNSEYHNRIIEELKTLKLQKQHMIHKYFDIDAAISKLENRKLRTTEKDWHPYTNILTLAKQFEIYFSE